MLTMTLGYCINSVLMLEGCHALAIWHTKNAHINLVDVNLLGGEAITLLTASNLHGQKFKNLKIKRAR
jgi:hypothetical protein